jgi:predicted amidohydrolase
MRVALLTQVFWDDHGVERLHRALAEARAAGAELAVLPELPLHRWMAAADTPRAADAESPAGPRQQLLADAARAAGVALLGGSIIEAPHSHARHNTALLIGPNGELLGAAHKAHLPDEPGWRERAHTVPGDDPPEVLHGLSMPIGIQICSDANRPVGSQILGALGAELILVPRATESATFDRWLLVLRANALTSAAYVVSVNRPDGTDGVDFGGPSVVIAPDGEVVLETTEPVRVATLDRARVAAARRSYPGYLELRADLYARGWRRVAVARDDAGGGSGA